MHVFRPIIHCIVCGFPTVSNTLRRVSDGSLGRRLCLEYSSSLSLNQLQISCLSDYCSLLSQVLAFEEETVASSSSSAASGRPSLGCVVFLVAGHQKYGEQLSMTLYYTAKNLLAVHRPPPPSDEPVAAPASAEEFAGTKDQLTSVTTVRRELQRLQQLAAKATTDTHPHYSRAASALSRAHVAVVEAEAELELFLKIPRRDTHPIDSQSKSNSFGATARKQTYPVLVFHDHHLNHTEMERLRQSAWAGLVAGAFFCSIRAVIKRVLF